MSCIQDIIFTYIIITIIVTITCVCAYVQAGHEEVIKKVIIMHCPIGTHTFPADSAVIRSNAPLIRRKSTPDC